jgi:hypothetical protein
MQRSSACGLGVPRDHLVRWEYCQPALYAHEILGRFRLRRLSRGLQVAEAAYGERFRAASRRKARKRTEVRLVTRA